MTNDEWLGGSSSIKWRSHFRGMAGPRAATVLKAEQGAAEFREFRESSSEPKVLSLPKEENDLRELRRL
jgi:hypothetical protein